MTVLASNAVVMSDEEFRLIRELIHDYCGIYLPESVKFLAERRLAPRLEVYELRTFRDYYRLLKYGGGKANEFDEVVERITTNETYFFRESYQLDAFTQEVLPMLTNGRDPSNPLRIWSAGCSTGEEPYSLAMLLEEIPWAQRFQYDIFGNDISRKVLRTAREALYRQSSFRQTDPKYVERHFVREGTMYRLKESVRRRVTFGHMNLMDEKSLALIANVDVIFCRNVMIYFAPESRMKLIQAFHRKLRPGGFLFLGHSESLINVSTEFEVVPLQNDVVYRRALESSKRTGAKR